MCKRLSAAAPAAILCAVALAAGQAPDAAVYAQKVRTFHTAEEFARLTGGRVRVERAVDPQRHASLRQLPVRWPVTDFTVVAAESPEVIWAGTRHGAVRAARDGSRVEYFAGLRWLPDDHVLGIGVDSTATWIETPKGCARCTCCRTCASRCT